MLAPTIDSYGNLVAFVLFCCVFLRCSGPSRPRMAFSFFSSIFPFSYFPIFLFRPIQIERIAKFNSAPKVRSVAAEAARKFTIYGPAHNARRAFAWKLRNNTQKDANSAPDRHMRRCFPEEILIRNLSYWMKISKYFNFSCGKQNLEKQKVTPSRVE